MANINTYVERSTKILKDASIDAAHDRSLKLAAKQKRTRAEKKKRGVKTTKPRPNADNKP